MELFNTQSLAVFDLGSRMMCAGFAGDDAPRAVFPSIIGKPTKGSVPIMVGMDRKRRFVGDEAESKRGVLDSSYPIEDGNVVNYDDFEHIVHHGFYNELRIAPEENALFLTKSKSPNDDETVSEKITQVMFETFNVPYMYYHPYPGLLSMIHSSRDGSIKNGIVVDCGATQSNCLCVSNGKFVPESYKQNSIGGRHVTKHLIKLIKESYENNYLDFTKFTWQEDVTREIKEKKCYISKDPNNQDNNNNNNDKSYTLSDGRKIHLGSDHGQIAPEILFNPQMFGGYGSSMGIVDLIRESVNNCPYDTSREDLFSNIILSGGSTLFQGFKERLELEMKRILGHDHKYNIIAPPERKYTSWAGGSFMAEKMLKKEDYVSKEMYDESGATVIRKCSEKLFF